jgi:hypothetical protein
MPPQPDDKRYPVQDAFAFRLEMLKKELDDIGDSIKNWAILSWAGSISIILGKPELYRYVAFSAIPPLLFMMLDAHWRRAQRRFIYRQGLISKFLNSPELDAAFETRQLNFYVFDPFAREYSSEIDFKRYTAMRRILVFPTVSMLYVGLAVLSMGISTVLYFAPPKLQSVSLPVAPPVQTLAPARPAAP